MEKIKIAMIANSMSINGISTVIMNYCRYLSPSKFTITIIAGSPVDKSYIDECNKLGIQMIELSARKRKPMAYYAQLFNNLRGRHYNIAHIHGNSATITPELFISFVCGIKGRIAHIHSSTCQNMRIHKVLMPLFRKLYTHGMACSSLAGKWIFDNNKFYVIPNGFETVKYKFSEEARTEIREKLGIKKEVLLGHVGRINYEKNQQFLIKIFNCVANKRKDIILCLVGTGPDFEKIKVLRDNSAFKERILLLGEQTHPGKYYSAFDAFLFPSRHEGLGIAILEAQISGLPCAASDGVPIDVKLGDNISFFSLNNTKDWINWIDNISSDSNRREEFYVRNKNSINKYEISNSVGYLENIYLEIAKK